MERKGRYAVAVAAASLVLGGCVAPLVTAAALVAGDRVTKSGIRGNNASIGQLRHATAQRLNLTSEDVTVRNRNFSGGMVTWEAVTRQGQQYRCEANYSGPVSNPICAPAR